MPTNVKTKVKGIRIEKFGGPEVLQFADVGLPAPETGQALVRLHAAGVNFVDIYLRKGIKYGKSALPYTPGLEGAGVIEQIGEGVTQVKIGDRVAFCFSVRFRVNGAYAQAAIVPVNELIPLPSEFSFEQGAAFPLQGMTAHYLLHEFHQIKPNETVLIHAAAGGMGRLLVQWVKHLKARTIGTVSSEEKAKIAKEAGVDEIIIYSKQDFVQESKRLTQGKGPELIIDGVGKDTFTKNLDTVADRGHIVLYGSASGPAEPLLPNVLQNRSLTISGGSLFNYLNSREELMMRANDVMKGMKQGWLKLKYDHVLPLQEAGKAHQMLENRQTTGKIILQCL
jgi:NADPH:quinone reductase